MYGWLWFFFFNHHFRILFKRIRMPLFVDYVGYLWFFVCFFYWFCEDVLLLCTITAGSSCRHSSSQSWKGIGWFWTPKPLNTSWRVLRLLTFSPSLPLFLSVCLFLNPTFLLWVIFKAHAERGLSSRSVSTAYATFHWRAEDFSHCFLFFFSFTWRNSQCKEFMALCFSSCLRNVQYFDVLHIFVWLLSPICQIKKDNIAGFDNAKFSFLE